ncbi:hypothetical protein OsJ_08213 [Oryza sativa Japonica Group]|uniref:Uncharacterized protein n=4 Tax=Oryza TaxID=4527 RepID=B9F2H0_ORYSJ|nr:hypothetical protein OsJ_08213 [Oryza sativa Japonica Group]
MEPDRVMFLVAIIGALLLSSSGGKWINFAAMATTAEGGGDVPPPGGEACRRVYDPPDENCDPDSCKAICSLRYNGVGEMSEYQNVVGGRLKLKGKALDVKEGGVKKKKKKKQHREESSEAGHGELHQGGSSEVPADPNDELTEADKMGEEGNLQGDYDHLTPAERRYMEQKQKIDMHKLAKVANKSHRDRIQDFNQYLANLSEHYDIPKVGPG